MNISSVDNRWSIISNYLKAHQASTDGASQSTQNAQNLQNLFFSADGDSLELSGDAQNVMSGYAMYGPPPPPPNGANGPGPDPNPEIKSFLDKVASGTATEDDLNNMQSVLQNIQQQSGSSGINSYTTQTSSDSIKSFLDKVADGTATVDDLTSMQIILQQVQQQFANNNVNNDFTNNDSDPIRGFLDKVANGTVTDEDLKSMQSILQQMQQQSGSNSAHMHHRPGGESDCTNPNGTNLDTTNANSTNFDLKNFLDKVADGTVTDEDLNNAQNILKQMQQQLFSDFGNYTSFDIAGSFISF